MNKLSSIFSLALLIIPLNGMAVCENPQVFDFIIVGMGAGGSVVANRLSENPDVSVLVLEAGRDDTRLPELLPFDLPDPLPNKENNQWAQLIRLGKNAGSANLWKGFDTWQFNPLDHEGDDARVVHYSRGSTWGGSTSHNFNAAYRGLPAIYDQWATEFGNPGWSYNDLIPFFKKMENRSQISFADVAYYGEIAPPGQAGGFDPATESKTGNVFLTIGLDLGTETAPNDWYQAQIDAAIATSFPDNNIGINVDIDSTPSIQWLAPFSSSNYDQFGPDFPAINPYDDIATWPNTPTVFDGLAGNPVLNARVSASTAYIYPVEDRQNLKIISEALASKVIFSGTRAIGVEYLEGWNIYQTGRQMNTARAGIGGTPLDASRDAQIAKANGPKKVYARKAVILAGGCINSPQLLLLSGVGPQADLQQLGISVVKDLPGVGQNLMEHPFFTLVWHQPTPFEFIATSLQKVENILFFKSNASLDISNFLLEMIPFPPYLNEGGVTDPFGADIPFSTSRKQPAAYIYPDAQHYYPPLIVGVDPGSGDVISQYTSAGFFQRSHISSRGFIKLVSKDPTLPPKIVFNLLQDPQDVAYFVEAFRDVVAPYVQNLAIDGFFDAWIDPMPEQFLTVGSLLLPDKSNFDEAAFVTYLKSVIDAGYHGCGTCKMSPASDPTAVVDAHGRVHGLQGLYVADASIMPVITTADAQVPTYVIGERISQFIKDDFSI